MIHLFNDKHIKILIEFSCKEDCMYIAIIIIINI